MHNKRGNCKGQVTIFIIIALIIVAGVVGYFLIKGGFKIGVLPEKFQPIEQYFLSCVEERAEIGARILGQQAGYIEMPNFVPGSEYRPFSNQLNFFGSAVPYWYYVSGNNLIKEQVPTKTSMQSQLDEFILNSLNDCDFSDFESQGYEISLELKDVSSQIKDNSIDVTINADLDISSEEQSARQSTHKATISSSLGKFYNEALKIYNYEKQSMFLENYSVDVLRTYAPVDGVELTCAPKVWMKEQVDSELKQALENNIQTIKLEGDYYALTDKNREYFVVDLKTSENINFLYSKQWPTRIEIWDSSNGVLLAQPVGLQAGLGILGFCYVPYHFVYDINYPVLVQIYNNNELFQFPVAIVIDKNKAREALPATAVERKIQLCNYKNQDLAVYTYDASLDPVEADISFECLQERCEIGKTKIENDNAILEEKFPQCVNGYIVAEAEGYARKRYLFSTNEGGIADIILDRVYNLTVDLKLNGATTSDMAIVTFNSEENTQTIAWPEQKQIKLSEGYYNVTVYVYRDGAITIPGTTTQKCVEISKPGIAGLFGATIEQCYDLNIPSQTISNVISGGGKVSEYIVESQLNKGRISIDVNGFPIPKTLDEMQNSFELLDASSVYLDFE